MKGDIDKTPYKRNQNLTIGKIFLLDECVSFFKYKALLYYD